MTYWVSKFGRLALSDIDCGSEIDDEFSNLTKTFGCKHIGPTAHHWQVNSQVQSFHRQLKAALRPGDNQLWTEILQLVLLSLRAAVKEETRATPNKPKFG